jgi:hypothetical protein
LLSPCSCFQALKLSSGYSNRTPPIPKKLHEVKPERRLLSYRFAVLASFSSSNARFWY